jgi:hypothetical protein
MTERLHAPQGLLLEQPATSQEHVAGLIALQGSSHVAASLGF